MQSVRFVVPVRYGQYGLYAQYVLYGQHRLHNLGCGNLAGHPLALLRFAILRPASDRSVSEQFDGDPELCRMYNNPPPLGPAKP